MDATENATPCPTDQANVTRPTRTGLVSDVPKAEPVEPARPTADGRRRELVWRWRYDHPGVDRDPTEDELRDLHAELVAQGREAWRREAARRIERFTDDVGERYGDCTLENYVVSCAAQQALVDSLSEYSDNGRASITAGVNVVLFGGVGTGKDHALIGLAKRAIASGFTVVAASGARLASDIRDLIGADGREDRFFRRFISPDVLLLSDPLPPGGALTAFQSECLYRIVDDRYRNRKAIWASLNVAGGAEADERLGSPIVDRLRDGALCIRCDWPSYRKPQGGE